MADDRFTVPLYTMGEAASSLGVPAQTFSRWARGYHLPRPSGRATDSPPIVTAIGDGRGAVVPFVGLAEGLVLAAFREAGVPLQRIRPALNVLQRELGVEHALASKRLFTDGAEVLYDFGDTSRIDPEVRDRLRDLVVLRNGQRVFAPVVNAYLKRITYRDEWASRLVLPAYSVAKVVADPKVNFGQPYFARGGVRVEDVLDRWYAGEGWDALAADYGIPAHEIEDAVRVSRRRPAA